MKRPNYSEPAPSVVLGILPSQPWRVVVDDEVRELQRYAVLSLSSWSMIRDAVRAGIGAALMPRSVIGADLAAGRIVSWGEVVGNDVELWALYPSRRLLNSRVSAFMHFLMRAYARSGKLD